MYNRLLQFICCPECGANFELEPFEVGERNDETSKGLLSCDNNHWYPIVRGIPRLLPGALGHHWEHLYEHVAAASSARVTNLTCPPAPITSARVFDRRTQTNFSHEWTHFEVGDRTWGFELGDRVQEYFLDAVGIAPAELDGLVVLDAGCGNGSQSVAYTEFGLEVIAVDLSDGLEHGYAYRHSHPGARADLVHFVQADLQRPPLRAGAVDIIHSCGVLHHTPDTKGTFRALIPALRRQGTFYIWLYKRERIVTPIVNALRFVTTRIPAPLFALLARAGAQPFRFFRYCLNLAGVRSYGPATAREASLALLDIFGAPYAHAHSFAEVAEWFRDEGFSEVWPVNESRRGFGACGRRGSQAPKARSDRAGDAAS